MGSKRAGVCHRDRQRNSGDDVRGPGAADLGRRRAWDGTPLAEGERLRRRFHDCRAFYRGGWSTDYPGADHNFSVRLAELTRIRVSFDERRDPQHVVVQLTDPLLFKCPILFMTNAGSGEFTPEEVHNLRQFFLKGGFLWVDDSWGSLQWRRWVYQISQILPPGEFPIFDVPTTHPMMRVLYNVKTIPQVPNINFWSGTGGQTSERGYDSAEVYVKGIQDARGRLMVLVTHNTDISDTWEREEKSRGGTSIAFPRPGMQLASTSSSMR